MKDPKMTQNNLNYLDFQHITIKPKKEASLKRIHLTKPNVTEYPHKQSTTNQEQQINQLAIILKSTMMKMETELARKNLLSNIISLMQKQQINNGQKGQQENQQLRKIKKIQNQINIYSNSSNQIIAKTKMMKQEILIARKNRAMFSVLFRDIEKEIKIYQDKFKELLLISEESLTLNKIKKIQYANAYQRDTNLHPLQLLSDTINLNTNFVTQPSLTNQAMNFYGGKKAITFIKPRKQYIASMRNIYTRDNTQDTYENLTNFIQKVCSVAQLSLTKMKDAMGPNGLTLKNDELVKKVIKVNQHIAKYQKKHENLLQLQNIKAIVEVQDNQKAKNVQKSLTNENSDQQIYNQILMLTNTRKPIKSQSHILLASNKDLSNPLHAKTYQTVKEKLNIILQDIVLKNSFPQKQLKQTKEKLQLFQGIKSNPLNEITLNNVLTNMKVYPLYERAFERMQFEAEYYYERNRRNKKRTTFNKK